MKRAKMNIPIATDAVWSATPTNMVKIPMIMATRRPLQSASHGEIGIAHIEPTDMMAFRRPLIAGEGLKSVNL